jgi:uncharacterized membrane protein
VSFETRQPGQLIPPLDAPIAADSPSTQTTAGRRRAPESVATAALALAGLGISAYLTAAHYQEFPLACSTTGVIDCALVAHSSYSTVAGLPVSLLGPIWFALVGACALMTWPAAAGGPWLGVQTLAIGGLVFVLYLVYAELVQLHRICEWCTGVHALTLGICLLTVARLQRHAAGHSALTVM